MHDTPPAAPLSPAHPTRNRFSLRAVALVFLALTLPAGFWAARCMMPDEKDKAQTTSGTETTVGGVPLFATWPKGVKPEVAIVLTGQTYGYMSPCGCSRPQRGGLERRANFLNELRGKGWPLMAVDLGDIAPTKKVQAQDLLKYFYTMKSLNEMGYAAVGLGTQDFDQGLINLVSTYSAQPRNELPAVLAANLQFSDGNGGFNRAVLDSMKVGTHTVVDADRAARPKPLPHLPVGVVGLLGPAVVPKLRQIDKEYAVAGVDDSLPAVVTALKAEAKRPTINVLLYGGSKDDTPALAKKYPDFNVILCPSEESEPPQFPTLENNGKTFVIQIGHKGQNVGVIGVFKNGDGYELKYQLVPMGEEFLTPKGAEAEKTNATLQLLEQYTAKVRDKNLLAEYTKNPLMHEAQIENPNANLSFVGSEKCQACHANEFKVWKESRHSHAMDTLEKEATRPANRQFDGDCVQCHSIGFGYQTGYTNEKDTPLLKHVGCESCHGPGSGHAANPKKKEFLASMSKWKTNPGDLLPGKAVLEKLAEVKVGEVLPIKPGEQRLINAVSAKCSRCHDQENDPKFVLEKYMPKIWHSGFKPGAAGANAANGLPPGAK